MKRLHREGGRVVLVPENPTMEPFEMVGGRVLGRVVAVQSWRWLKRLGLAGILLVVLLVPQLFSTFFASTIGVQSLVLGIAAASIIFLNAIVGMVSLAQTALYGIAAYTVAKLAVEQGVDPWMAALVAVLITVVVALMFGAVASRSEGIYFLMITLASAVIAYYFFSQVTTFGSHEGINGVVPPALLGKPFVDPTGMYYAALICSVLIYLLIWYLRRTPFGYALQGVRDEPVRMRALGFNVPLLRTAAFGFGAFMAAIAGVLLVWYNSNISPGAIDLTRTLTDRPFGVNFHMFQPGAPEMVDMLIARRVPAVSFGRGPDRKLIARLQRAGIRCVPTLPPSQSMPNRPSRGRLRAAAAQTTRASCRTTTSFAARAAAAAAAA